MSDTRARGTIRLKLQSGLLPPAAAGRVWAGHGADEVCSGCDEKITPSQTLYEWAYDDAGKIVMHLRCWEIWNKERQRARRPRGNSRRTPGREDQ
jgi:hypothetical protein